MEYCGLTKRDEKLKIFRSGGIALDDNEYRMTLNYGLMLSNLAIAESNLVKAGKDSALQHFIAIVKELERIYGFTFELLEE
jgi:hypothetical protein